MKDKKKVLLANSAARLLNDEAFIAACDGVRAGIIDKIEQCSISDHKTLHELKIMLKLLKDIKYNLTYFVSDGSFVLKVEHERAISDRIRGIFNKERA